MSDPTNDNSVPVVPPASGDATPVTPPPAYTPPPAAPAPVAPETPPAAYGAPAAYGQPTAGQPGYPQPGYQQPGYAPTYSAVKPASPKTLSLIGMIVGIVGVLSFGWFVPASIAALVLGYMGKKREGLPAKGFWLTAIITGWVGVAITVLGAIGFIVIFALTAATGTSSY